MFTYQVPFLKNSDGRTTYCCCIGDDRRSQELFPELVRLITNYVRRYRLDELDELEGLGLAVATVHLTRELNK